MHTRVFHHLEISASLLKLWCFYIFFSIYCYKKTRQRKPLGVNVDKVIMMWGYNSSQNSAQSFQIQEYNKIYIDIEHLFLINMQLISVKISKHVTILSIITSKALRYWYTCIIRALLSDCQHSVVVNLWSTLKFFTRTTTTHATEISIPWHFSFKKKSPAKNQLPAKQTFDLCIFLLCLAGSLGILKTAEKIHRQAEIDNNTC